MENRKLAQAAADSIIGILSSGIELAPEAAHCIDSTIAPASVAELEEMLKEPDNCDSEAILELIFFPDLEMQEKLEPVIGDNVLDREGQNEIAEKISRADISVPVRFPDGRGEFSLKLPEYAALRLVERLNLHRKIDPEVAGVIEQEIQDFKTSCRIRVKLRNSKLARSGRKKDFLCSLIPRLDENPDEFWSLLCLAIEIMEQTDPRADMYEALMDNKKLLLKSIQKAEKNRQALESNTVEALIMRGESIPSISVEKAREKIDRIDRLSVLVYGRTEFFSMIEPSPRSVDLEVKDKGDLDSVIRFLKDSIP